MILDDNDDGILFLCALVVAVEIFFSIYSYFSLVAAVVSWSVVGWWWQPTEKKKSLKFFGWQIRKKDMPFDYRQLPVHECTRRKASFAVSKTFRSTCAIMVKRHV